MRPAPLTPANVKPVQVDAFDPTKVIFVGMGASAVCWYRCALPAMFMGADWIGVSGSPPDLRMWTGMVRRGTTLPNWDDYDVVVIQQPRGGGWLGLIRRLQSQGKKVIFEVDDYLHAIRKLPEGEHDFAEYFGPKQLASLELCMRCCDAVICSTPYIKARYSKFARRSYVCANGIDAGRYELTRPYREAVHYGWAGGTGHGRAMRDWLPHVQKLLDKLPHTCFVSIGQPYADQLQAGTRTLSLPWSSIETYPAAMTNMDVALAPAVNNGFYRGKSDLRWVEAGALGIPTIADRRVYPNLVPGVTGFWADTPQEAGDQMVALVEQPELRADVGEAARTYVRENRHMGQAVDSWVHAIGDILETHPSD